MYRERKLYAFHLQITISQDIDGFTIFQAGAGY
jgi:hypothetical protein